VSCRAGEHPLAVVFADCKFIEDVVDPTPRAA